jgi:hypothetical protein
LTCSSANRDSVSQSSLEYQLTYFEATSLPVLVNTKQSDDDPSLTSAEMMMTMMMQIEWEYQAVQQGALAWVQTRTEMGYFV